MEQFSDYFGGLRTVFAPLRSISLSGVASRQLLIIARLETDRPPEEQIERLREPLGQCADRAREVGANSCARRSAARVRQIKDFTGIVQVIDYEEAASPA